MDLGISLLGLAFGFDGKTLIHPSQIAPANAVFSPDAAEIAWAERVVAAFGLPEHRERGAIRVEGRMVERLQSVALWMWSVISLNASKCAGELAGFVTVKLTAASGRHFGYAASAAACPTLS